MVNPYVLLGAAGAWLASLILAGWLMYTRGHDDMRNAYTEQTLSQTQKQLDAARKGAAQAQAAGENHEKGVQIVHDTTREIVRTVQIPPDNDPVMPVAAIRLFDRAASRSPGADPYPGQSPNASSGIKLSEVIAMLVTDWADKYYTCQKQVDDIAAQKPVLPSPVEKPKTILEQLNPF